MNVSYNNLFKQLIDNEIKKAEWAVGLAKKHTVSMKIINKIHEWLDCYFEAGMEMIS